MTGAAKHERPDILAPAGQPDSFLAALAAGADAVYAGLKHFSARMQADNFAVKELARFAALGRDKGVKTYVALNTMLKPGDLDAAGRLLDRVAQAVRPDGIIVQDPGAVALLKQIAFEGEIHLSTLAAVSPMAGLETAKEMGARRVVLAREFHVDEIKAMQAAAEELDIDLEAFVHGALCFCVSGRCYWSSYMGGKSGLRGRCVQPCRRRYSGKGAAKGGGGAGSGPGKDGGRVFSCTDLSLDILAKTLLQFPRIKAWKIEGRKKGPHYVFYAVTAYKMLRDHSDDPAARKEAVAILERALGRQGSHGLFLPQNPHQPLAEKGEEAAVASGMLAGRVALTPEGGAFFSPRFPLLKGDLLRIGAEDDSWHQTIPIRKAIPKAGRLDIRPAAPKVKKPHAPLPPGAKAAQSPKGKGQAAKGKGQGKQRPFYPRSGPRLPPKGAPVYLIDRREAELASRLGSMQVELEKQVAPGGVSSEFEAVLPPPAFRPTKVATLNVQRALASGKRQERGVQGLWMTPFTPAKCSPTLYSKIWWWLPPVIWPEEEEAWKKALYKLVRDGGRRIVCNAPWQLGLLPPDHVGGKVKPVAGPFCNLSNALAIGEMQSLGFDMAIISPELGQEEILALPSQSPLPLGIVVSGAWPVGVTRYKSPFITPQEPLISPKGEAFFTRAYGPLSWIYPAWPLDLSEHQEALEQSGYGLFINLKEPRPRSLDEPARSSPFNWEHGVV